MDNKLIEFTKFAVQVILQWFLQKMVKYIHGELTLMVLLAMVKKLHLCLNQHKSNLLLDNKYQFNKSARSLIIQFSWINTEMSLLQGKVIKVNLVSIFNNINSAQIFMSQLIFRLFKIR